MVVAELYCEEDFPQLGWLDWSELMERWLELKDMAALDDKNETVRGRKGPPNRIKIVIVNLQFFFFLFL